MERKTTSRRDLLRLTLGLGTVAVGWQVWIRRPRTLDYTPLRRLPRWRRVEFEGVSSVGGNATSAVFVGLDREALMSPLEPSELCALLYPRPGNGLGAAIFTDVNCPNCRSLEAKLASRAGRLTLEFLDLPLLGPNSVVAARALVAAALTGTDQALRREMAKGPFAAPLLPRIASRAGLDVERLRADMEHPEVEERLLRIRRAAATLGIWGTPGLTLGRTLAMGDMPGPTLDRLIAEADGTTC